MGHSVLTHTLNEARSLIGQSPFVAPVGPVPLSPGSTLRRMMYCPGSSANHTQPSVASRDTTLCVPCRQRWGEGSGVGSQCCTAFLLCSMACVHRDTKDLPQTTPNPLLHHVIPRCGCPVGIGTGQRGTAVFAVSAAPEYVDVCVYCATPCHLHNHTAEIHGQRRWPAFEAD
jgi:hypothetical protein